MLITFTTEYGTLVIRAEDLRRLEDAAEGCTLGWVEEGQRCYAPIQGTAAENQARIVAQETAVIAAYEEAQRRAQMGPPDLRLTRGGKVRAQ